MKPVHVADYLTAVKKKVGITSDYALAQHLGVSRQAVSQWQSGTHIPDLDVCWKIADELGIGHDTVIASVELERAIRAGKALQEATWLSRLNSLGNGLKKGAGTTLAAAIFSVGFSASPDAQARALVDAAASTGQASRGFTAYTLWR